MNGSVCTELAARIDPEKDVVEYQGKRVKLLPEKIYLMLNKPKNYLVTHRDDFQRKTVYDLLPDFHTHLFAIGRLDYRSEGLLLFTNDGDFAHKIIHPRFKLPKVYKVSVKGKITGLQVQKLQKGVEIDGKKTQPAIVFVKNRYPEKTVLRITIFETIFNALTGLEAETTAYSTGKVEPNFGIVEVKDERITKLSEMYQPKKTIYATIEYIDFVGLTADSSKSGVFSDSSLALVKTADALALVIRNFSDDVISQSFGNPQPLQDIESIDSELIISDLIIAEKRLEKIELSKKRGIKTPELQIEEKAIEKIIAHLNENLPLRSLELHEEEEKAIRGFQFISRKPLMIILNSDENNFGQNAELISEIEKNYKVIEFAGKFEMELGGLSAEEAKEFMEELNIKESARDRLTKFSYELLGYISFFTVGKDEVRAWTIKKGNTALEAAGKIHSDLARGFIRAECLWFAVFLLSILFLVALSAKSSVIFLDYQKLKSANLSFGEIIGLQFPTTNNLVGPFGAFFAFWFSYIFGKYFSLAVFLGTALLGIFHIFYISRKNLFLKIFSFWTLVFFGQQFAMIVSNKAAEQLPEVLTVGVIHLKISEFFTGIFGDTGTQIITIAIALTSVLMIFEVENIKKVIVAISVKLWRLFLSLFSRRKKTKVSKIKKETVKKEKVPVRKTKEETVPNIIDHVAEEDEEEPIYKPKIPKRKLSQNPEDMPDEPTRKYEKPDVESFLISAKSSKRNREEIEKNIKKISKILEQKLAEFSVDAEVINVNIGPIITQYEIKPAPGVKVSKFHSLVNDLALAIKAKSIRVQAPIPGRGLIGIEIPNINRDTIFLKDILLSEEMRSNDSVLAFALGKDISGNPVVADLAGMPHLLIAGATGSGKSVCVNTIINSLLFRTTPEEVRLVLIDPKRIELSEQ
ncbi:MAG: hypothetical protein B6D62_00615 [Candidatus Cloacimonas sp. 4484_275]|nr:MAG: hypothetical protein B6D62_00615 [Candidatus Cloacimonas sp. 4484_275]